MIKPFKYQEDGINEILDKFKTKQRVLYQLSTGGGKTFIFCFLTKKYIEHTNKKILILCHRTELINQTVASMTRIGVTCESVTSKTKELNHSSNCYVAMVETANNRLNKNPYFFKDIGLIIADECHLLVFDKVFSFFPFAKILGCTATPVVLKREQYTKCKFCSTTYNEITECCNHETMEFSKPYPLSNIYEDIVLGPKITELIEMDRLVKEISFVKDYANLKDAKTDSTGEFTKKSLDTIYSNEDAVFNVILNYEELCKGKKTIVFNNSSTTNLIVYNKFLEAGYNVRMFDSVNKEQSGNRKDLIKWFSETPDAILCNVSVFTTGFDVTDVEAIILNRATNSLSLFLQMVGRGVRVTDKIYKDSVILIDGGGNIDRHQEFSDPTRDWYKIFKHGIGKDKAKKEDAIDVKSCDSCGYLHSASLSECPECGFKIITKVKNKVEDDTVFKPIIKLPPPNGKKIVKYTISQKKDSNFAIQILIKQVLDLFQFYGVSKELYITTKKNGKLYTKIHNLVKSCYFDIIFNKEIQANNNRTIDYIKNKIINKLDKKYEI